MGTAALHDTWEAVKQQQNSLLRLFALCFDSLQESTKILSELSAHTHTHTLADMHGIGIFHLNVITFDF